VNSNIEIHNLTYNDIARETGNRLFDFLLDESNLNDKLLAQTAGQRRPSIQERSNPIKFSSHEWEFPDNKLDDEMQAPTMQRNSRMDALLSHVGSWSEDFGREKEIRSSENGRSQTRRRLPKSATTARKTSHIGPWC
jgi:hypothetical protein